MRHCFQMTFSSEGRSSRSERATAICKKWARVRSIAANSERLAGIANWDVELIFLGGGGGGGKRTANYERGKVKMSATPSLQHGLWIMEWVELLIGASRPSPTTGYGAARAVREA